MASTAQQIETEMRNADCDDSLRLNELERRLLNEFQKGLPLSPTPYREIAGKLGTSEALVLQILQRLRQEGIVSRVGPVFKPKRIGASTLAAIAVPPEELDSVAAIISGYAEVNHNYEREDRYNLWFVITAQSQQHLEAVMDKMERRTGYKILDLPLIKQHHIDLGFPLWC
jgi:DNA-binding Lrp family transcriptional regulator